MNSEERTELINYRIKRAKDTFEEVSLLSQNKLWSTAINRLYYACYYAVIALLVKNNITAQTHNGVRQMFGLHFVKTGIITKDSGKFYSEIFDKRLTGDYDDFVDIQEDDVVEFIEPAQKLISEIELQLFQ